jgi:hypothetical protein
VNRGSEPVTPELALVDPALAEAARRALPNANDTGRATARGEIPNSARVDIARSASEPVAIQPDAASSGASSPTGLKSEQPGPSTVGSTEIEHHAPMSGEAPARRKRSRFGRRLAVCALLGACVWIGISQLGSGSGSEVGDRKPIAPRKPEQPVRHASTKHSSAPKAQVRQAAASGHGRARTFGWIRDPKASFYAIEFSRGARQILEARATQPRLVVPAQWTYRGRRFNFEPGGRYTWIVRPAFRSSGRVRYGAPIVRAKLVVSR